MVKVEESSSRWLLSEGVRAKRRRKKAETFPADMHHPKKEWGRKDVQLRRPQDIQANNTFGKCVCNAEVEEGPVTGADSNYSGGSRPAGATANDKRRKQTMSKETDRNQPETQGRATEESHGGCDQAVRSESGRGHGGLMSL